MNAAPEHRSGARGFGPGDRVTWSYRPSGGYGYAVPVAGVVRAVFGARATIEVARKVRGQWSRETRTVRVKSLVPRTKPVPEVDDEHGR